MSALATRDMPRFRRLVRDLHRLGPRPSPSCCSRWRRTRTISSGGSRTWPAGTRPWWHGSAPTTGATTSCRGASHERSTSLATCQPSSSYCSASQTRRSRPRVALRQPGLTRGRYPGRPMVRPRAGEGGGVLDLIAREEHCDRAQAMQWLLENVEGAAEEAAEANGHANGNQPSSAGRWSPTTTSTSTASLFSRWSGSPNRKSFASDALIHGAQRLDLGSEGHSAAALPPARPAGREDGAGRRGREGCRPPAAAGFCTTTNRAARKVAGQLRPLVCRQGRGDHPRQ